MTHTDDLLYLISDFPAAFSNPEENRYLHPESVKASQPQHQDSITDAKTRQLLRLADEFPIAFADLEKPPNEAESENDSNAGTGSQVTTVASPESSAEKPVLDPRITIPLGYAHALHRRIQTLTWGHVDFHLVYGDGLEAIWAIAGKSGTEVQSLCEAACRLINLLLSNGVPISRIVQEIRGIRGADSEGLGPNRILGLVDLIGKVLQEAPIQSNSAHTAEAFIASSNPSVKTEYQPTNSHAANLSEINQALTSAPESTSLGGSQTEDASLSNILTDTTLVTSALCPECGAELQQVNGCKGGACIVCGHSSCS